MGERVDADGWKNGQIDEWMSDAVVFLLSCRKETCGRLLTALSVPALKEVSSVGPNSVYQSPPAPR